jgi:ribonuclease D
MDSGPDNKPPGEPVRRTQPPRFHHRARNHESAHSQPLSDDGPQGTLQHSLVCPDAAQLITEKGPLEKLIEKLRSAGSFAYDSEFIGELSYVPRLCLIQVAWPSGVALIDPLADLDLMPFWRLLCDASIEKVVHAGQQDVEPVFRLVGEAPANLFDVQIAAGMVGLPYPLSLSKLVLELVGAKLGKGLTFTSWDQRPLSARQIQYAADDVRYLPAARAELARRLETAGHAQWAAEASSELCQPGVYRFDPEAQYLKIRGSGTLDPKGLAVLRALTIWRDRAAREADVPPRTYLGDEILLGLARSPVKSADKLGRIRGLPRQVEAEQGDAIIAATTAALALPADQLPESQHNEPMPREKFACDGLWASAQAWCFGRGIDPNLVSNRQEIGDLLRELSAGGNGGDLRIMRSWRRAALGEKLLELAKAHSSIRDP